MLISKPDRLLASVENALAPKGAAAKLPALMILFPP